MSKMIKVAPSAPGEITYDPETKTATHVKSGMAVQFSRWGAYTRESDVYFNLTWNGVTREFRASYDGGGYRIMVEFPHMSDEEQREIRIKRNEMYFETTNIGVDYRVELQKCPRFCEVFVETWWNCLSRDYDPEPKKIIVEYDPFFHADEGGWEFRG